MTSSRTKQGARRDKHEPLPLKTNNTTGDPSRDYLLIPRTDRCFFQSPLNWGMNSALCWPQMKRKSSLETLLPGCLWSRLNRPCSASEIGRVLRPQELEHCAHGRLVLWNYSSAVLCSVTMSRAMYSLQLLTLATFLSDSPGKRLNPTLTSTLSATESTM